MRRSRPFHAAAAVMVALAVGSCSVKGLSFVQDDRVEILAPDSDADVAVPLTVTWSVRDFDGTFGVLVDRSPPPPGESLSWYVRNDDDCELIEDCPNPAYLAERGIYSTSDTTITIDRITSKGGQRDDIHEVTIILLDADGRRIGESAWYVEFEYDRSGGGR